MSFQSLPLELIRPIFQHLQRPELRSLCSACSRFRDIAQPLLYARLELWWDNKSTPPIISLLRTIMNRPRLASLVRELVLDGNRDFYGGGTALTRRGYVASWEPPTLPPRLTPLNRDQTFEVQAFEKFVPAILSPQERQRFASELQYGNMDAFVTLLVSLVPHLQSLKILNGFAKEVHLLGLFFRALIPGDDDDPAAHSWPDLQEVTYLQRYEFDGRGPEILYDAKDILPLFYLPHIKHMSVWINNPTSFSWPSASAPQPTNLVSLHLTRIREMYLEPILRQTKHLKVFSYRWLQDEGGGPASESPVIDLVRVFQALSHVRKTLEELTIRLTSIEQTPDFSAPFTFHGSAAPLKNYPFLKRVTASPAVFMGFSPDDTADPPMSSVLPPSVERVTFYMDVANYDENEWREGEVSSMVEEWFDGHLADTPCLRELHLHMKGMYMHSGWSQKSLNMLRRVCERYNIEFKELSGALTYEEVLEVTKMRYQEYLTRSSSRGKHESATV